MENESYKRMLKNHQLITDLLQSSPRSYSKKERIAHKQIYNIKKAVKATNSS